MPVKEQEVKDNCPLNERVEEEPKEAKEAALLFNASTVDRWCRVTKQRSPRAEYPLSNHNWPRSYGRKERT